MSYYVTISAQIIEDDSEIKTELPVIVTDRGPFLPLVDYFLTHINAMSSAWIQKNLNAIGLLIDYYNMNHHCFGNAKDLFASFCRRLSSGTINDDGDDFSGLGWFPRTTKQVNLIISYISRFLDWYTKIAGIEHINPWRKATHHEQLLNWAAYHHRHSNAFLGHSWDDAKASEAAEKARTLITGREPFSKQDTIRNFSDKLVNDLIYKGFIVPGKQNSPRIEDRLNLRNILITLLMHFGGIRVSEAFHIFVHDVIDDPLNKNSALVRIFHPVEGLAPDDYIDEKGNPKKCRRLEYLSKKWHTKPRNMYRQSHRLYAGFKNPALDNSKTMSMNVFWFPTFIGELFKKLWYMYLIQRSNLDCDHPFAFVTQSGKPFALRDFQHDHKKAVERIGEEHSKNKGTTPHGHRHAMAQRLIDAELDKKIIRSVMHHKSLNSQKVYTVPSIQKVTSILNRASQNMENNQFIQRKEIINCLSEISGGNSNSFFSDFDNSS